MAIGTTPKAVPLRIVALRLQDNQVETPSCSITLVRLVDPTFSHLECHESPYAFRYLLSIFVRFFGTVADVLEALVQNIEAKSRFYKKGQTLTQLFLLNNYFYISKAVRTTPGLLEVINGPDSGNQPLNSLPSAVYERPLKQNVDQYQDNWKTCVEHLMDVTYVQDGGLQQVLNSNQRQMVKDKFKNFNHDFDELWKTQKQYSIPDVDLRAMVLKDVHQVLIPMYDKFLTKYASSGGSGGVGAGSTMEFTKNVQKYIRYDVSMVKDMVAQFFTNS